MLTATETKVRVLLVEDDPLTREILSVALSGNGFEVCSRPDGTRLEGVVESFRPDIALLDLCLGQEPLEGITVARRLRSRGDLPLVFLTAETRTDQVLAAFSVGADDYVTKPFVVSELIVRMQAILRRSGRARTGRMLAVDDLVVDLDAHQASRAGHPLDLTRREFALLVALCRNPGVVLSKLQLLSAVWGFEHYDLNVVEVHLGNLRRKLEDHGERLIHTVRGVGYLVRKGPDAAAP